MNTEKIQSSEDGFLALMSAIIISAVLMIVIFSVSFFGFMTRFNILDSEYKARSYTLAEGYANDALLKLAQKLTEDSAYTGPTVENISGTAVDYYSIGGTGGSPNTITINAHSVVEKATTNIQIIGTYDGSFTITDWKECAVFAGC